MVLVRVRDPSDLRELDAFLRRYDVQTEQHDDRELDISGAGIDDIELRFAVEAWALTHPGTVVDAESEP